ncbi:MAG TPA: ATP-binding protein [Burkholderiaceae bacterium]|jgi:serine/threonine-protein kinase RsbW|nr:ATP-binding protein [Burkholderiaceae bacterium]
MKRGAHFARRLEALEEIVAFSAAALEGSALDARQRHILDFAIEELFTNMVKYEPEGEPTVFIEIDCGSEGAQVTLIDTGVEPFDVVRAPDAQVDLPLEERRAGGLGLHLLRRLVSDLRYDHDPVQRQSRICFRVGPGDGDVRG